MSFSPFPYKVKTATTIEDGVLFSTPLFCKRSCKQEKCLNFYKELPQDGQIHQCPYGFGAIIVDLGKTSIIQTCLNIEKISDRKQVQRRLCSNDFIPRINQNNFNKIILGFKNTLSANVPIIEKQEQLAKKSEKLEEERILLENTLHELRKLNNQLKFCVERFSSEYGDDDSILSSLCTDIYSISSLLSIRFDFYDFEVNPDLSFNSIKTEIPVYRKVEKVYKCLGPVIRNKSLRVHLEGKSFNKLYASSIFEIAIFIIIENAVKYAPENSEIKIRFQEASNNLKVTFSNWGIRPEDNEIPHLTEREYRSVNTRNNDDYEGRGIGLYLLKKICDNLNINMRIIVDSKKKIINNVTYSPFSIELSMSNMLLDDS